MKFRLLWIIVSSFILLTSCENDELESEWVDVTVIGEAVDCRENWIIKYEDPVPQDGFDRFQEIGLPSEYKTEGMELNLRIRDPKNEESLICTTLGIRYPSKIILEAKRK